MARHVWHVSHAVIRRAAALLEQIREWFAMTYRELTDGAAACGIEDLARYGCVTVGRDELVWRWYRHRYPSRFG